MSNDQTVNPIATNQNNDSMKAVTQEIEKELLNEIINRLKQHRMSPEEAKKLAKDFLSELPFSDQKDLLEKLKKLSQNNTEVAGIYLHYAAPQEEADRQKKLELMSKHIQEGNIEQALAAARGGVH